MGKLSELRDYALVAYLMVEGYSVTPNSDGSFCVEITLENFEKEEREYRLRLKPILTKIAKIKRSLSAQRPRAVNPDLITTPKETIPEWCLSHPSQ